MVTKDQERAALEQIKRIVASLGDDSYIATALDGALDLAQENIDNDWASSARYFIDKCHRNKDEVKRVKDDADAVERRLNEVIKAQGQQIKDLERDLDAERLEKSRKSTEAFQLKEKLGFADGEIVRLKAKLFDLMHPDF